MNEERIIKEMKELKGHDAYIEAVVGAIYYDSNFEITKQWIYDYLYPLLVKYKVEQQWKIH